MALWVTIFLTLLKFWAAWISGSVGVLSEGIHSALDFVSAGLAFYTVRHAVKPADEDHPFGHGKFETLSALCESLLLILAAILITWEGIDHFRHPTPLTYPGVTAGVMALSLVASYFVYRNNFRVGNAEESLALQANALHFLADVVTCFGVLVGLALIAWTGAAWIDPVLAFLVAGYIVWITASQLKVIVNELSDVHLPENELEEIRQSIGESQSGFVDTHDLRTRRSGATRHIDFHMTVCGHMTVDESHRVCDQIEDRIHRKFPEASVNIHVEPCVYAEKDCEIHCSRKGKRS